MICRFTSFVFALLTASAAASPFAPAQSKNNGKAAYTAELLRKATPTENSQLRRLDQNGEVDITGYYLKFMQCQFVKAYDDEMADDEDAGTVLATQRFVTFRLCKDCDSCSSGYGEYIIDLETYLESTVAYYQEQQEDYCQQCEECNNGNQQQQQEDGEENGDDADRRLYDCGNCYQQCQFYENFEEQGYVDAADYLECQQMGEEDNYGNAYFAGPICSDSGAAIKIGVFTDEFCSTFASDGTSIDDLIEAEFADENDANAAIPQLTYHTLGEVAEGSCVSCLVVDQDAENDGNNNQDKETTEMCENLYEMAAKCEDNHGFEAGMSSVYNEDYWNQIAQQDTVCGFIKAVNSGVYDEEGVIKVSSSGVTSGGGSKVTVGQQVLSAVLVAGIVGLIGFAAYLHSSLTKGSKADLSSSGGAMA